MTNLSKETVEKLNTTVRIVVNRLLSDRRFIANYIDREDLYQLAWVVVMKCAVLYDASRGASFETYCSTSIRNAVGKELKRIYLNNQAIDRLQETALCLRLS